jgi:hypothetical protein
MIEATEYSERLLAMFSDGRNDERRVASSRKTSVLTKRLAFVTTHNEISKKLLLKRIMGSKGQEVTGGWGKTAK